jgi:hypothetical protein
VRSEFLHAEERRDGHEKIIVAFCNVVKAPKKYTKYLISIEALQTEVKLLALEFDI